MSPPALFIQRDSLTSAECRGFLAWIFEKTLLTLRNTQPTVEQPSDFRYHLAHVLILSPRKPAPLMHQAQVQAQFRQMPVCLAKMAQANFVPHLLSHEQFFLKI